MNVRKVSRTVGVATAIVTVIVLAAPYAVISGHENLLISYYSAGPIGAGGIGLFALMGAVVLASIEQGNVDPGTLAGVAVVLSIATTVAALLWYLTIDPNVLFSFPPEYQWLEWHAPAVLAVSLPLPACAGLYARELL
ncbi:DUF7548 family protein [Halorubrum vacuolatum]|uniref:Uncharacterized protein n=1 Tax=Halorubrum vacuolatum TaxID=63740 RepID=A0A238V7F9_HALVU|nr:hypothetical protein [Halorubrum vacuolatum]SNR29987.1 hypothetical protein SAMN06264855_1029 [Halorubrum vacuolatum]